MLLWADQKAYVSLFADSATLIINTLVSILLIKNGASVHIVKLVATAIFVIRPIVLTTYVSRNYNIDKRITYSEEPIKQKWNGFAQHLASVVMDNTDVIILTLFSTLENVSIYYVYHLVVNGIRQLITSVTVGVQSYFGRLVAIENRDSIYQNFKIAELLFHFIVTVLFLCVSLLIVPFIKIYTSGVHDLSYINNTFAYIITAAQAIYCYRLVYFLMIKAAGHYKETQSSAIIEMFINLSISIVFVIKYGLVGVAIGTLAATLYRTIYFVYYLSRNIINIKLDKTLTIFSFDIICIILSVFACSQIHYVPTNYFQWLVIAFVYFVIIMLICLSLYCVYILLFDKTIFGYINRRVFLRQRK